MTGMHHVVIIGGGFGGLNAAKGLRRSNVKVTLIDRRNFHLFQPLLYQVATGELSPGDIAVPLRSILRKQRNVEVSMDQVVDIDNAAREVMTETTRIPYDTLIVATGTRHHYFGHDDWEKLAPGLKSLEQALGMRNRIFSAFEAAELEPDPEIRKGWLRFVIVGAGPTGVELAGTLAEIARKTVREDFRRFDSAEAEIILIEGQERVLPLYPEDLSAKARRSLERLGVRVRTGTRVEEISSGCVTIVEGSEREEIPARTVLWGAGVKASHLGADLALRFGAELDNAGRVQILEDLTLPGHPEIFVIGDLAVGPNHPSGVAQVAIQGGKYAAMVIRNRLDGKTWKSFRYRDKGILAVIGRNSAVAQIGRLHLAGFPAWLIWAVIHIANLVGFDNKLLVMLQWGWNYVTFSRSARIIYRE
jgi:NADH dehydrogenase